jgi:GMP synthase (glutamine-hydrolysing)
MKVLLVNNYISRDKVGRLENQIKNFGASVETIYYTEINQKMWRYFDCIILSGSEYMLSNSETVKKFEKEMSLIAETEVPLLGICFGHQLIGKASGADVFTMDKEAEGYFNSKIVTKDRIFSGLRGMELFWESHKEAIKNVPEGFILLAEGETNRISAIRSERKELYGVQFHPEVWDMKRNAGGKVLRNFLIENE